MVKDDTSKKEKMGQVYGILESALQSLQEAHRICYEELHPTWQTVDQDIEVIKGSLQTIVKDLQKRDIGEVEQKAPIILGPAPGTEPIPSPIEIIQEETQATDTTSEFDEETEFPPECPWCGSYRTKKHTSTKGAKKVEAPIFICGSCENTFSESREKE